MAQFLGDIAFLLEMVLVAGGLVLLHRSRQEGAGLLRAAALVLLLAGAGTAICTSYFWFHYHGQADFDHAYPMPMASMMQGGMMGREGGALMPEGMHESGAGRMMQHPSANPPPADR